MQSTRNAPDVGVNLFGFLSSSLGLGEAARATADLLRASDVPTACVDIELLDTQPVPFECERVQGLGSLPFGVNIYHMNPPEFLGFLLRWRWRTGFRMAPYLNVMVPFWELPEMPSLWTDVLGSMDVILAPSHFVADSIRRSLSPRFLPQVIHYPQAVVAPQGIVPDRDKWLRGRDPDLAVLFSFDAGSEIERKNPAAAVRAFEAAFPDQEDAVFVLKVSRAGSASGPQWDVVKEAASRDPRIIVIDDHLTRHDLWQLFASVDVYLSLHRSEGLGLGMMEAMALGKVVVATGWSGNMDFTDSTTAMLVPYAMKSVSGVQNLNYAAASHLSWADPDVAAAAEMLRTLSASPDMRASIGRSAIARIEELVRQRESLDLADLLIGMAPAVIGRRAHDERCRRAYRASRRSYPQYGYRPALVQRTKRTIVRILRSLKLKKPGPEEAPPTLLGSDSRRG